MRFALVLLVAACLSTCLMTCVDNEHSRASETPAEKQADDSTASQVYSSSQAREQALASGKHEMIVGYESYELNQPVDGSILKRFVGPHQDKSQPEVRLYELKDGVFTGDYTWGKITTLVLRNGLLKAVFVDYTVPDGLRDRPEEAWSYVRTLRQKIVDEYDGRLVKKDRFYLNPESPGTKAWQGVLLIEDDGGRLLAFIWKGHEVMISCWEEEFATEVREEMDLDSY